jgi:hypothetical protein
MRRKEAISEEGAERIRWYAEMQQQMFANPPEPQISDDDDDESSLDSATVSTRSSNRLSSSKQPDTASNSSFQNFAASLAAESAASREIFSKTSSSTKLSTEKPLRHFPSNILNKALIRLNSPQLVRSVCLSLPPPPHLI